MKLLPLVSTGHLPAVRQEQDLGKVFGETGEGASEGPYVGSLVGTLRLIALLAVTFVAVLITGTSWFIHTHSGQVADTQQGFTASNAEATATANTILSDPLNQNIHNWPVGVQG